MVTCGLKLARNNLDRRLFPTAHHFVSYLPGNNLNRCSCTALGYLQEFCLATIPTVVFETPCKSPRNHPNRCLVYTLPLEPFCIKSNNADRCLLLCCLATISIVVFASGGPQALSLPATIAIVVLLLSEDLSLPTTISNVVFLQIILR